VNSLIVARASSTASLDVDVGGRRETGTADRSALWRQVGRAAETILRPLIEDSLRVIDAILRLETPSGRCWRRYNHDGYGQRDDGGPFEGWGTGRAWPLLTGERGHYAFGGVGRGAVPPRDGALRESCGAPPGTDLGRAGPAAGPHVPRTADRLRDAAHVGACRVREAPPLGTRWPGVRPHPRRCGAVPSAPASPADRGVGVQPSRALGTTRSDAPRGGGGPVPSALDRQRVVPRAGHLVDADGPRNRVCGRSDRAPPSSSDPVYHLLAGDRSLGSHDFQVDVRGIA
jgi:hypothetical protein